MQRISELEFNTIFQHTSYIHFQDEYPVYLARGQESFDEAKKWLSANEVSYDILSHTFTPFDLYGTVNGKMCAAFLIRDKQYLVILRWP